MRSSRATILVSGLEYSRRPVQYYTYCWTCGSGSDYEESAQRLGNDGKDLYCHGGRVETAHN